MYPNPILKNYTNYVYREDSTIFSYIYSHLFLQLFIMFDVCFPFSVNKEKYFFTIVIISTKKEAHSNNDIVPLK
jgi:hypothetical protein